jgi:magnesium-transporting ATPase (P-type)
MKNEEEKNEIKLKLLSFQRSDSDKYEINSIIKIESQSQSNSNIYNVIICLFISFFYFLVGSFYFFIFEEIHFGNCLYWAIITFTTVKCF